MPPASHRLDLLLVPDQPERPLDRPAWDALLRSWIGRGHVRGTGPGPAAEALIEGGFRRLWLDDPGRVTFFGNHQGGFRVTCPATGLPIAPRFSEALTRWRGGGPRALDCPACGASHLLEAVRLDPPGAFGPFAVCLADVSALHLRPAARLEVEAALGPMVTVWKRVG